MRYAGPVEFLLSVLVLGFVVVQDAQADRRMPAEWEEQTGVWMQWPKGWHRIQVDWFNKTGGVVLDLRMGRLGNELTEIPNTSLAAK